MFHPPTTVPVPSIDADGLLLVQRRLVYEVSGEADTAAVLFCDHPRGITLGREASRLHVRHTDAELVAKRLPLAWVARGGGAMLHLPGQITCYPILPLEAWRVTPAEYAQALAEVVAEVAWHFDVPAVFDPTTLAVRVGNRRLCGIGAAVRQGVSLYGLVLNVDPDLEEFRLIECDGDPHPMTSLQRESPHRVRLQSVQQRLTQALALRFSLRCGRPIHDRPITVIPMDRHADAQRDR